ncbi:MAG TPA: AI-2E family transporter [Geminicoccaceae bacterium]|nr:AI-2E family transporter [Geminicoccus sp.]HMU51608.1 AI-2E family transporter [Geminicoccaceae bacterium]
MTKDRVVHAMLGISTAILALAALHLARPVLAPVVFAIFVIAIVWPVQRVLQRMLPTIVAMVVTLALTVVIVAGLASIAVWGVSQVARSLLANAGRFQEIYQAKADWLEQHGIYVASILAEHVSAGWLVGIAREISVRVQGLLSFTLVTLVFIILGLLEVDTASRKLEGRQLLASFRAIAAKFQRFMLVRTLMSVSTGIAIWAFTSLVGLELATAWGVIGFVLNYIPVIGPFVATVLPSLFAVMQFDSWQAPTVIFLCLNVIQFLSGSYFEPRIAGAALSLSPFMVLFAVFFWTFLWGIPGAFIGVPIIIALHSLCASHPETRWLATTLAGEPARQRPG